MIVTGRSRSPWRGPRRAGCFRWWLWLRLGFEAGEEALRRVLDPDPVTGGADLKEGHYFA